jgi:DnaJ-domain-containing protein 1
MLKLGTSEAFVLCANAALLAGMLVLPSILAGYVLCKARVRDASTEFTLGKLESVELDRAVLLYQWARERQHEIRRQCAEVSGTFVSRYHQRRRLRRKFAEERDQLGAYAGHLRATILRLRRAPMGRLTAWLRVRSLHATLGGGLVLYAAAWVALMIVYQPYHPWRNMADDLNDLLLWEPVDFHLLLGNLLAASLALTAMPTLYGIRRIALRREHRLQLRDLRDFAKADPDVLIAQLQPDEPRLDGEERPDQGHEASLVPAQDAAWFDVLGVSPSASLEQVKQAYRLLVKQNHPDRVHGMSPQFHELAERETRKLNEAYEEAVASLRDRVGVQPPQPLQG